MAQQNVYSRECCRWERIGFISVARIAGIHVCAPCTVFVLNLPENRSPVPSVQLRNFEYYNIWLLLLLL